MPQYVDIGMVESGCSKIDEAIAQFNDAKNCINDATTYLDHNSLRFGGINSSLEEQLDLLKTQLAKCDSNNDGVTSTIRANAQAQLAEYNAWLEEQRRLSSTRGGANR